MNKRGHQKRGCKRGIVPRCEQRLELDLELDVIGLEAGDLLLILGVDIGEDRVAALEETQSASLR
jgi:hypothetical protein